MQNKNVSVIIPVLNEEKYLPALISFLQKSIRTSDEIIIVDGGSTDGTKEICQSFGIQMIESNVCSRAKQMNTGAHQAKGDILYFLHADAVPPKNFIDHITQAIENGFHIGGYPLQIGTRKSSLKSINSLMTRFNLLIFQGGGDQSMFIKKSIFHQLHGFDESFVIMEDFDFIRRCRKKKLKRAIMEQHIQVSDRKYQRNSYLKVQIANLLAYSAFSFGVSPVRIRSMYGSILK